MASYTHLSCPWMTSQLVCELGPSLLVNSRRRRRKKMRSLGLPLCHGRSTGLLMLSSNSTSVASGAVCGRVEFDLGCGYFTLKVISFCKPQRYSLRTSVALVWALEQQAIGDDSLVQESNLMDRVGNSKSDDCVNLNGKSIVDEDQANKKERAASDEENEVEKNGRIDVRALALSLHSAKTADDVEEVLKDKGELPLQVYSTMIRGFGRDKVLHAAFALFEWLKRKKKESKGIVTPSLFIYNSVLGAVKQSEQFGEMEKVLNNMALEGVVPNVVTYNIIMAIYLQQGKSFEALSVLQDIKKKGLKLSPVSYSTALLVYRKMEDGSGAIRCFTEIRDKYHRGEQGKDPGGECENEFVKLENLTKRVCYQVMRRWLVKDENLSTHVLKLLMEMDNADIPPGRSEYERLLWACTREDHHIVAKELYNRIREQYSEISLSVSNHTIWVMGTAKKWWAALEIYEDLLDRGPKPNNMSYELIRSHFNILLTAARKRGIWKWGFRLLNKMDQKGLKPGSKELNSVLIACSKASETSAAVLLFKRMVEQGQKPTIISYGALLSALEKGKLYDEARQVWEHMIKVGMRPNLYAYTIMASVFAGQGKFNMVDIIIDDMVSSCIEPTVVTYNAIISGCARNGMSSAAYEWFLRMKAQNISPNNVTYEMIIDILVQDGKPMLAYELYSRAQNEGVQLSPKAYDTVVQSSDIYGASIGLRILGSRPPDRKSKM